MKKRRFTDLSGSTFNMLKVISLHEKGGKNGTRWNCLCECGNTTIVNGGAIKNGMTKSCGCFQKSNLAKYITTHGLTKVNRRLYQIWNNMHTRCENHKSASYKNYGAKGISVCKEWGDIKTFFTWALSNGYSDCLTIDRVHNSGNYEPSNCRWVTPKENGQKTSRTIGIEKVADIKRDLKIGGISQVELSRKYNVHFSTISDIKRGKSYSNIAV